MADQLHCASCGTLTDRTALSPYRSWCAACRERGGPPAQPDAAALRTVLLAFWRWENDGLDLAYGTQAVDEFLAAATTAIEDWCVVEGGHRWQSVSHYRDAVQREKCMNCGQRRAEDGGP